MAQTPNVSASEAKQLVAQIPWWYHTYEIAPGVMTPGVYEISGAIDNMLLPKDMKGMSVLEIGPADGAFTKAMWERGADVTAVEYVDRPSFELMVKLSGCTAKFIKGNVLTLSDLKLGQFDLVLMMGVLYHLPDPFHALWLLRQHVKESGALILETLVSPREGPPVMEYLPRNTRNNDWTNFWAPNPQCCKDMLVDCGMTIERAIVGGERGIFHARIDKTPGASLKATRAYAINDTF